MKKLLLLLLISLETLSQTTVSGPYFSNTIWNVSDSPYNIVGDVQIPNGVSLTIESGVVINFEANFEILIKGSLIANGTNSSPIIFNSSNAESDFVKSMIIFKDTNLSESQLSYLEFNGPKKALQLANESEHNQDAIKNSGMLTISNTIFKDTQISSDGYDTNASLRIENSSFESTKIIGTYPLSEQIFLENCQINNSNIISDSYNYGIIINACNVENTDFKMGCCNANFQFTNSNIINSTIIEGGGSPVNGLVKLDQCEFNGTTINLPNARVESYSSVFHFESEITGLIFGNGSIQCSQFSGNNMGTSIKITGYSGYNIGNSVNISNSTIKDNEIGIDVENSNTVTLSSSNIFNNSLYNIRNKSSKNILATNNWWGSINNELIKNKIFDFYNDINFGVVDFSNYSNSLIDILESCPLLVLNIPKLNETEIFPYPNPTTSIVSLQGGKEYNIEVYDMAGNKVMALTGNTIDMSHLSSATYIVKALDKVKNEEVSYKVVKN